MFKRLTVSTLLVLIVFLVFLGVNGIIPVTASYDNTAVARAIMHYDYGGIDMTAIMRSNSTLGFKLGCVYDYILTRNSDDMEINISAMYEENKNNSTYVIKAIKEKAENDKRLFVRGNEYYIKLSDVDFSAKGYDYIAYNGYFVKLKLDSLPKTFSNTKGNQKYLYSLVQIVTGVEESTEKEYTEYRFNKTYNTYGGAIRLYSDDSGKVTAYRVL